MNTYIILAAGKGRALEPLTLNYSKTSYRLDENTTMLQRMVRTIRLFDKNAEIVVVLGHQAEAIRGELSEENVKFVMNPFYAVTNSIASVWFARSYLERENVTIVHADAVFSHSIIQEHLVQPTDHPYVLVDSSCHKPGTYNAVVQDGRVLVMSKQLENFNAKYCCMTKLDPVSSRLLKQEIDSMIQGGMHDLYFEDCLVQMIMFHGWHLACEDIAGHQWAEVDCVDDLLLAQKIHQETQK